MTDPFDWAAAAQAANEAATDAAHGLDDDTIGGLDPRKVLRDALAAVGPMLPPANRAAARARKRATRKPGAPRQARRTRPS